MKRLVLLLALLAGACATPDDRRPVSVVSDPDRLEAAATLEGTPQDGAWPAAEWWRDFHDEQLDTLIAEALAGSPGLRAAEARVRRADALAETAGAQLAPQATMNGQGVRQRFTEHGMVPPSFAGSTATVARLTVDFAYELDFWGRSRDVLQATLTSARAARVEAAGARQLLAAAVARAYVEFDRLYQERDAAEADVKRREALARLTADLVRAGLAPELEKRSATGLAASARAELAGVDERLRLVRNQLAALAAQGPDRGLRLQRPRLREMERLALPAAMPADLLGRRADLVAQRLRVEAAAGETAAARKAFYPNVNLIAFLGLDALGLRQLVRAGSAVAGVGPAVRLPLFDGGRLRGNLAARNADYDLAVEQYNDTLITALRDVADQLATFRGAEARLQEQQTARRESEAAYRLAETRYRAGLASWAAVLSVEGQAIDARRRETEAHAHRQAAAVGLIRALGGGYAPPPANN